MNNFRITRCLPLTLSGVLQALTGLERTRHGVVSEDLSSTEWHDGPNPAFIELIQHCMQERRFDLLEQAAKGLQGEPDTVLLISVHRVHEIVTKTLPSLAQSDFLRIFEEFEPELSKRIPKSKKGISNFIKRVGLKSMPQVRGYGDSEYLKAIKEIMRK